MLIILLALATVGSFGFTYMQGYFQLQIAYFMIILLLISGFFYLMFHKSVGTTDYQKAMDTAKDVLEKLGKKPTILRAFAVRDGKRFSKSGQVWDVRGKGSPQEMAVLLDEKSGKVKGVDLDVKIGDSPVNHLYKYQYPAISHHLPRGRKRKTKIEEEVKDD